MAERVGLSFEAWPESDKRMWRCMISPSDLFADEDGLANLRPTTLHALQVSYGYYLGHLSRHGILLDNDGQNERVSHVHLRGWVEGIAHLKLSSQAEYATNLLRFLQAGFPDADLTPLRNASLNLARRARKKPSRLIESGVPAIQDLVSLGHRLVQGERSMPMVNTIECAENWRDGLAILFLCYHPIRVRNLAELAWDSSLVKSGDDWLVRVPPEETKNHRPLAFTLDPDLAALMKVYRTDILPIFPETPESKCSLWRTRRGTALAPKGLGRRIGDVTEKHLGRRATPHAFRRAAATGVIVSDDADSSIASKLLSHSDPRVTRRYYILSGSLEVSRRYVSVLSGLHPGNQICSKCTRRNP